MNRSPVRSAWQADRYAGFDDPERFLDERDVLEPGEFPPEPEEDAWSSGEAHDHAAMELEGLTVRARMLVAEQFAALAQVLRDAAEQPEPWVGADPTLQPDWSDPRDRTAAQVRRERQ